MTKDGSVEFDARVKTGDLEKDLEKMEEVITDTAKKAEKQSDESSDNIRSQVAKLAAEYKKAGMESSEAMKKAWAEIKGSTASGAENVKQTVQRAFKDTKSSADSAFSEIAESAEDSLSDSGQIIDEFSDKMKSALTVAGITAVASEIVKAGTDYDKAMQQVAASTGTAGKELENLQTIASNVYSNNFGENMEDAASGVTEIYKRTGLIDKELQKATESAFLLKDTFGYEVAESTQAASQLMKVFGITADEAYTLIAQGAQQGLDQNGDLLDTLNEYSVQFANLGYSADDMLNMLKNGVDKGTWSVDKLGDAVKEMNIRLNDGTADEALQALGLGFAESAADAKELEKAALSVSKAEVSLTQAQNDANKILAESGENSLEYRDALNDIAQAELDLADAESAYNSAASATNYNLDGIKSKLAAGGETAKEAQQQILTALMSVEDEQERYVLGQTIMGTMWEDLGEDAVNALMNTHGEISRTKDTLEEMSEIKYDDLGSQFEALRRQAETEIIVPLAKKYMPKIKEALGWVSENLDEIVSYGKPIATALAAAFAVAKVVEFGNAASKTIKGIKTALTSLNTSNPVGWILTAVGAVAGLNAKLKDMSEKRIPAEILERRTLMHWLHQECPKKKRLQN
ncbi:MAG: phage tail tape measure protein [Ruminococcus sp.]